MRGSAEGHKLQLFAVEVSRVAQTFTASQLRNGRSKTQKESALCRQARHPSTLSDDACLVGCAQESDLQVAGSQAYAYWLLVLAGRQELVKLHMGRFYFALGVQRTHV